jgi:hypothetical protein
MRQFVSDRGGTMGREIEKVTGGRDLIGGWADDGYEWMTLASLEGWRAVSAWGRDGWDLGDWPYVVYMFRDVDGRFERASYCEGDVTIETYATAQDRSDDTDESALFYWLGREESWVAGLGLTRETKADAIPDHLRGPYSRDRVTS